MQLTLNLNKYTPILQQNYLTVFGLTIICLFFLFIRTRLNKDWQHLTWSYLGVIFLALVLGVKWG